VKNTKSSGKIQWKYNRKEGERFKIPHKPNFGLVSWFLVASKNVELKKEVIRKILSAVHTLKSMRFENISMACVCESKAYKRKSKTPKNISWRDTLAIICFTDIFWSQ
jgi:hypothetical protein